MNMKVRNLLIEKILKIHISQLRNYASSCTELTNILCKCSYGQNGSGIISEVGPAV